MAWKDKDLIKIEAEYVRENGKNIQLDCEGDLVWFPKSQVNFDKENNSLELPVWLHKEKFPGEPI